MSNNIFSMNRIISEYAEDQKEFLANAKKFIDSSNTNTSLVLAGYAGTGKTTLIENLVRYAATKNYRIAISSFTNKAVYVIAKKLKGIISTKQCMTLHSILYGPPDEDEGFSIGNPMDIAKVADILIIDEASTISRELAEDIKLARTDVKLIFIGDPFQLPPVGKPVNILNNAKTILKTVKRQGETSEILKLATEIRDKKRILLPEWNQNGDVTAIEKIDVAELIESKERTANDTIAIVATNRMRVGLNKKVRNIEKRKDILEPYEQLISISNSSYYRNGETFIIREILKEESYIEIPISQVIWEDGIKKKIETKERYKRFLVVDERGLTFSLYLFPYTYKASIYNPQIPELHVRCPKSNKIEINWNAVIATYGYAISCHKSQGSQWSDVFICQDIIFRGMRPVRWFYTALTRAIEKAFVDVTVYR